jgi:hypothetical protein
MPDDLFGSAHDMHPGLNGPDASDAPEEMPAEQVGDPVEVTARQFVHRWVMLPHHRAPALRELHRLLDMARSGAADVR